MSDIRETVRFNQPVPHIHLAILECVRCAHVRSKTQLDHPICGWCYTFVWGKDKCRCVVCKAKTDERHTLCKKCYEEWTRFEASRRPTPVLPPAPLPNPASSAAQAKQEKVVIPQCPIEKKGGKCHMTDEKHLSCYTHRGAPEDREICPRYPHCFNTSERHLREYSHPSYLLPYVPCQAINTHDPREPGKFTPEQQDLWEIDFIQNQAEFHSKLVKYMNDNGFDSGAPNHLGEIAEWYKGMLPAQMCSGPVLLSMIKMNSMNSTQGFRSLWIHPEEMADSVLSRPDLSNILKLVPDLPFLKEQFIIPLIKEKQGDMDPDSFPIVVDENKNPIPFQLREFHKANIASVPKSFKNKTANARAKMLGLIGKTRVALIEQAINDVLDHVKSTLLMPIGIAWAADERVRSDFTVFSIVGPHMGAYGGGEVILLMKPEIMYHPDFNMTMYAASGFYANKHNWYHGGFYDDRQPWMGPTSKDPKVSMEAFSHEKYHRFAPGWEEDAAREWICRVYHHSHLHDLRVKNYDHPLEMNEITLDHVKALFINFTDSGSHTSIEGHVPCSLPLEYVDRVIIMKKARDEVCANPLGKAFLDEIEARGDGHLLVVDDKIESVWGTAIAKSGPKTGPNVPSGFTFTVSETQTTTTFVPLHLRDVCTISFGIVGGSFSMFLTNFPDYAKAKPNGDYATRNRVYIEFDIYNKTIITRFEQVASVGGRSSSGERTYNLDEPGAPTLVPEEVMYWGILFNREKRIIRIKPIGKTAKCIRSEVAIRDIPESFSDLGWIGYSKCRKPYSVWDLNFTEGVDIDFFI